MLADAGVNPAVLARPEGTPFYARSVLDTQRCGTRATAVQEALSLRRFAAPLVQAMLPFRNPCQAGLGSLALFVLPDSPEDATKLLQQGHEQDFPLKPTDA